MSFHLNISNLVKKLKMRTDYFRNKSRFTFSAKKNRVGPTCLSATDYGHACSLLHLQQPPVLLYVSFLSPHSLIGWTSLTAGGQQHWYMFIYEALNSQNTSVPFLSALVVSICTPPCGCSSLFHSFDRLSDHCHGRLSFTSINDFHEERSEGGRSLFLLRPL